MAEPTPWQWTKQKYNLANLIAGGMRYKEAGEKVGYSGGTVKKFMSRCKEFREYVDKITLENELITRAGATRLLLNVIEKKRELVEEDKDTMLTYLKYLHELAEKDEGSITELEVVFK